MYTLRTNTLTRICTLLLVAATVGPAAHADEAEQQGDTPQVAHLRLARVLPEEPMSLGLFATRPTNLKAFLDRLRQAADDENVRGVVLEIDLLTMPLSHAQELRAAIAAVQRSGKPVLAVLPAITGTNTYVAAAGCDRVVMPADGWLMLTGIRFEVWFFRDLFNWLGVDARFLQAGAYKGAAEPFTRSAMSPQYRAQLERVADDLFGQICTAVAGRMGCSTDEAAKLIDQGPFLAREAKQLGLIDDFGYGDPLDQAAARLLNVPRVNLLRDYGVKKRRMPGGLAGMMQMMQLLFGGEQKPAAASGRPRIALIYATGPIIDGKSTQNLFLGRVMGDKTIVEAVRKAEADEQVRAIVLRVDSPGGSATASEHIYQALREAKKPVIVSMGNVAASGGYYISLGGDIIVAEPSTLTGSIGVVGGKIAVRPALAKLGIKPDVVQRGRNADFLSVVEPLDADGEAALRKLIDATYDRFVGRVAEARGMDRQRLTQLAEGRIWTGKQAAELGLVDRVGSLYDALELARERAGIGADEAYELLILPEPKNFFEMLMEMAETDASPPDVARIVQGLPRPLRPVLRDIMTLRTIFERQNPGVWLITPYLVRY